MARYRRFKAKRKASRRGFFGKVFKRSRKGSESIKPIQLDSMIYGALRAKTSSMLAPLTSRIPLGVVSDEVGMGIITYLLAKNTSGMIRDIAKKGLIIENARVGEAVADGSLFGSLGMNKSSATSTYIYG